MYPFLEIYGIRIFSFGLSVIVCVFLFVWMLNKLSNKFSLDYLVFKKNFLLFFLSSFLFSRLFYLISRWNDFKHIDSLIEFFIMSDYNFSLFGMIFGFLLVFISISKINKISFEKYIPSLVLSFLFVLPVGFFGALLGGQVFGKISNIGIEISYSSPFLEIPNSPVFPLPIFYIILFFILFCVSYILITQSKNKLLLSYLSSLAFCFIVFFMDFFSGKYSSIKEVFYLNISQISAIVLSILIIFKLKEIIKDKNV